MPELLIHDRKSALLAFQEIQDLYDDGRPFTVTFQPEDHEPYTTEQLNKCHAMFGDIAMATHHTVKEAKTAMMLKFFPATYFDFLGERFEFRKSFTDLNKADVSHLIDSMGAWAAEQGYNVL